MTAKRSGGKSGQGASKKSAVRRTASKKVVTARAGRRGARKPNILMVAIDSLLSTHMSCYGYSRLTTPHIDKFARDAALFEQTFSPHVPTTSGYSSMLTGRDCFGTQCVALRHKGGLPEDIATLPEVLRGAGYQSLCVGFTGNAASRGFDRYIGFEAWGSSQDGYLRKAEGLNEAFLPELDRLAKGRKPFLALLRHMDPHTPYLPPAPFDRLFYQGDPCDPANKSMDPVMAFKPFCDYFRNWMLPGVTDKDYVIAQYDGAVAYMDSCIQHIFERLEFLGILDDTIVVINSDHGETLYDHECWFDHHGLYDVTLKVPTIIRYPARVPRGVRVKGYNQLKDLMPTLLELAGIEHDMQLDGRSLMRLVDGTCPSFESGIYVTECTWMRKHGWRTPEWKLILAIEPDFHFKPRVELYNLVEDPDENNNVAAANPGIVRALTAELKTHVAAREKATGKPAPILHQPGWHSAPGIDYFKSSKQAYNTLHIGNPDQARKISAEAGK